MGLLLMQVILIFFSPRSLQDLELHVHHYMSYFEPISPSDT